jgi:hypothetical protein
MHPSSRSLMPSGFEPTRVGTGAKIVGVYRRRNASHVVRLLEPALERGWGTAWWALDGADRLLADITVGEGPGEKFPLVNEVLRLSGAPAEWTLVSDDDIRFLHGDVVRFLHLCTQAGLDIAQPGRARGTKRSHEITVALRFVRARLTTFVESGPLFAVGPRWRDRVLPLPCELGMGWGIEFVWFDLMEGGCRLGIVDSVSVKHLGKVAAEYDTTELYRRVNDELAARGAKDFGPFQQTLDAWRPWQWRPAWVRHQS